MPFQIHALDCEPFAPPFVMTDAQLRERNVRRAIVTVSPGSPCRVSLADAGVGETVILMPAYPPSVQSCSVRRLPIGSAPLLRDV